MTAQKKADEISGDTPVASGPVRIKGGKNRLVTYAIVVLILVGAAVAFRQWVQPTDEQYRDKPPPIPAGAKGDPLNTEKLKRLPAAQRPSG